LQAGWVNAEGQGTEEAGSRGDKGAHREKRDPTREDVGVYRSDRKSEKNLKHLKILIQIKMRILEPLCQSIQG